jgi:hypothetical protein
MLPELLRLASLLNGVGLREELLDSILRRFTRRTFGKIGIHALVQKVPHSLTPPPYFGKAGPRQVLVFSVARCFELETHDGHASRTQNDRMNISALHVPEV